MIASGELEVFIKDQAGEEKRVASLAQRCDDPGISCWSGELVPLTVGPPRNPLLAGPLSTRSGPSLERLLWPCLLIGFLDILGSLYN